MSTLSDGEGNIGHWLQEWQRLRSEGTRANTSGASRLLRSWKSAQIAASERRDLVVTRALADEHLCRVLSDVESWCARKGLSNR